MSEYTAKEARAVTHNKAEKSSMELITAFDSPIVIQALENAAFLQRELGIKAGLFLLT